MNCPNCINKYNEDIFIPRILNNCGHTICERCIYKLVKREEIEGSTTEITISCPNCCKITATKDISFLTKNLALIELNFSQLNLHSLQSPRSHSHSYSKSEINSNTLQSLAFQINDSSFANSSTMEYLLKKGTKSKILCAEHSKDLDAFCDKCKKLLCVSCIIESDHKNHELISFEKAFSNESNWFKNNFDKILSQEEKFDSFQNDLTNQKDNLNVKFNKQIETVENFFQEVISIIKEREKVLKEKLLIERENEDKILFGFGRRLEILKKLVDNLKSIKNNFTSLSDTEILSNTLETSKIYKEIFQNLDDVYKLYQKREFQFSQLERQNEVFVLKDLIIKKIILQKESHDNSGSSSSKNVVPNNKFNGSKSIKKIPTNPALNTSINKGSSLPPEPVKFNFIKSDMDSFNHSRKPSNVLNLFPQLKPKQPESSVSNNNIPGKPFIRNIPDKVNYNFPGGHSKTTKVISKMEIIDRIDPMKQKQNLSVVNDENNDMSMEFDEKEFKDLKDLNILKSGDNSQHDDQIDINSKEKNSQYTANVNEINLQKRGNDKEMNYEDHKYIPYSPIRGASQTVHDSNVLYQIDEGFNQTRNEVDFNDFQISAIERALEDYKGNEINKNNTSTLNTGDVNFNNITEISGFNLKSTLSPQDLSSLNNKPTNPFVIVLGGKSDFNTKRYSVDQETWIVPNINTNNNTSTTNDNSLGNNNGNNTSLNNMQTPNVDTEYNTISIERSDFIALMYKDKKILIIGGKVLNEKGVEIISDTIDLLNIKEKNLSRLSIKLKQSILNFGAVYNNSKLYISGGSNGREALNNFGYFDKINKTWVEMPRMLYKRKEFSLIVGPDSCIYAIGGADDKDIITKSVEKFDSTKNCWTRIADMNQKRKGCSGVCMPDGIYIFGGFDGCQYLKSVEKYDFITKKWSYIEDMNQPRCFFSSCVSSDLQHIYVVGGYDGKPLNTTERYDVFTNKWRLLEKMNSPKYRHQCIFLKD